MMACWRTWALCSLLVLPGNSSQQCAKREKANWHVFKEAMAASGLAREDGISNILADLRTGALSQPVPHTYVVVGGGEWGPRVVAKALLESVYEDWSNDVVVLDMEKQPAFWGPNSNLDEAQEQLNRGLCVAIKRCVGKAVVVLDNVHLLKGEDLRVLDTMLSLTDGRKSNMDCDGHKVSGEGCLFLLLLNEEGSEGMKRLSGKDRLLSAWEFRGMEFTTRAFVGRVDVAVSLSQEPSVVPEETKSAWQDARNEPPQPPGGIIKQAIEEWTQLGPIKQAVSVVATAAVLACAISFSKASSGPNPADDPESSQNDSASSQGDSESSQGDSACSEGDSGGGGDNNEAFRPSEGSNNNDDPSGTTADDEQRPAGGTSDGPSTRTRSGGRRNLPVETGTARPVRK
ncbi:unnamed protein product [Ectocarpus fasciculatus]